MRQSGFLALFGMVACLAVSPARADARLDLTLEYEAYFGGMHIGSARASILREDVRYRITGQARARGLLDWYSGWQGNVLSEGVIGTARRVEPERHENEGLWQGSPRRNLLVFSPDGSVTVEQESPPDSNKLTPIPEESISGSIDPLSAILSLAGVMETGGDCKATIPIYDGRRRYDIQVAPDGMRDLKANPYTIFSGQAQACRFTIDRIGGIRTEKSKYQEAARDRRVWVANPLPDAPPIPVRVEVETDLGQLVIHLTAARYRGMEIALEPGTDNLAD